MSRLINIQNVKQFSLDVAHKQGREQFERVSKEWTDRIEARLRAVIVDAVQRHPSKGKTLK